MYIIYEWKGQRIEQAISTYTYLIKSGFYVFSVKDCDIFCTPNKTHAHMLMPVCGRVLKIKVLEYSI